MSQMEVLHAALNDSITSGRFIDTKFYVFSRRDKSGRVGTPKALFANSRVLTTIPYFETLFSDKFSEGLSKNLRDGFPSDEEPYTDSYECLPDSDLDEEEDYTDADEPLGDNPATDRTRRKGVAVPDQESAQDRRRVSSLVNGRNNAEQVTTAVGGSGGHPETARVQLGKVAIIRDVAATTFEALLYYLYTGKIYFAPFGSEANRSYRASEKPDWKMEDPPKVSPKSIYRVADKYDLPELKQLAWQKILENLDSCDLVEEIFSDFTFFFPQIQGVQVKQLICTLLTSDDSVAEDMVERLQTRVSTLSGVRLERSAETLGILWEGVSKGRAVAVDKEPSAIPSQGPSSKIPGSVKVALLYSIHTGTFEDYQYVAKSSNGRRVTPRPIYFSSVAAREWSRLIQNIAFSVTADRDPGSGCETDSDLEDEEDTEGLGVTGTSTHNSLGRPTEVGSGSAALLLRRGAWRTWRSLFSYIYTGEIRFSPLRSENAPSNLPLSCSPKSAYSLAKSMALDELARIAYKRIKRNISASNIVTELFSSFTASHDKILDMESDLLFGKFENDETSQEVQEHIRAMSCGEAEFQGKTLASTLGRLIARKRRTTVRCARYQREHVYTLSELLEGVYCPICHEYGKNGKGEYGRPFTRCGSCNVLRDAADQLRCVRCKLLFESD